MREAAAIHWQTKADECFTSQSQVFRKGTGQSLKYSQLCQTAARITVPESVPLKEAKDFGLIGKPFLRKDIPEKVLGKATFGIDLDLPNLLYAAVAMSPVPGGVLRSMNQAEVLERKGVKGVVPLPEGVAVVAESYYQAQKALEYLKPTFGKPKAFDQSTKDLTSKLHDALHKDGGLALRKGHLNQVSSDVARWVEFRYDTPFLAHVPMEPINFTAHDKGSSLDLYGPTQSQEQAVQAAAKALNLPPHKISIKTTYMGGGFGRRDETDYVVQAALISRAAKAPVQVLWSRETDIARDFFRPAGASHLKIGLNGKGFPVSWQHKIAGPSITQRVFPQFVQKGLDPFSVDGAASLPYDIPHMEVRSVIVNTHIPVGWWRGVANTQNAFYIESAINELAHQSGMDPLSYRLKTLKPKRFIKALQVLDQHTNFRNAFKSDRFIGMAIHRTATAGPQEKTGAIVAIAAEVTKKAEGLVLSRITAVVDAGFLVDPQSVEAQISGAILDGVQATFHGNITLKEGAVEQSNFHDYRLLALRDCPDVQVHLMQSMEAPGGVGEVGVSPVAPAIADAFFAATGRRHRRLPLPM